MEKICVLGLGYIGLPTASMLATHGFEVIGVDVNPKVVETVNRGSIHIQEPGLQTLVRAAVRSGNLRAAEYPEEADVFIIAVPTPVTQEKKANLDYIRAAANSITPLLRPGNIVLLESTSPPGTCQYVLRPILEAGGLRAGVDFSLAYCPERVLPGRTVKELIENERVIGGIDRASAEAAARIYRVFVEGGIHLTSCTTAEMVKLMENIYRDVNIALANELAIVCERLGIDAWEVINLANLHPRVNIHLPGPGVGGHCLAVDPWFIVEQFPDETSIISLARRTNDSMPNHVVARLKEILSGEQPEKATVPEVITDRDDAGCGWKVAVLGVAYKGNIDDARETPALPVLEQLEREGFSFTIYDPHVRDFPYELSSFTEALVGADCLLILTDHDEFKFLHPLELGKLMHRRIIFDTRNIINPQTWQQSGFQVYSLGRGTVLTL